MRVAIDASALARALGDRYAPITAPGALSDVIIATFDVGPFIVGLPAGEETPTSPDFVPFGSGRIRTITFADPAAGADFLITVPNGSAWEILGLEARFVASATAATRTPRIAVGPPGAGEFMRIPASWASIASQNHLATWARGINSRDSVSGLLEHGTDLPHMLLGPGYRIVSTTNALQVGDQWSQILLHVREFAA